MLTTRTILGRTRGRPFEAHETINLAQFTGKKKSFIINTLGKLWTNRKNFSLISPSLFA
jgi:hypothetical protein